MDTISGSMMGYFGFVIDHFRFVDDLRFAIGFPLGIILLMTLLVHLVYYLCIRHYPPASHYHHQTGRSPQNVDQQDHFVAIEVGLDEAILHDFPKLLYSQYKLQKSSWVSSSCSICLDDYKESDVLQLMPDCGHLFHPKCIHPWLRLHPNCPLCRNTLVPIPNPTLSD
ncbi:hypothetical protein I3843_13G036300 [Carya illinoinensis]|uniref:RING-type domain-containing protein n=1 Tax=Carya illinoinensis TaxID=32201 RepID=A0A8T1NPI2_CARIL|nr:hypothetical protein I3760_13G043500 [Carya illinoinensis]KAG6630787.1 hypothetical protein CIPAW_13G044600 [Carya illinoinensis]KAG6680468.1 hypothetical protein I3842_13G044700 [Carya illinoinensis]KAG7948963.1 hypothetical protein I3843_13G036300 [Carya illinoinensis]